jgi:hypothetical protein
MRNVYKIFVGKPRGNKLLVRPVRRGENNIETNAKQIRYEDVDCIHLASSYGHSKLSSNSIQGGEFIAYLNDHSSPKKDSIPLSSSLNSNFILQMSEVSQKCL